MVAHATGHTGTVEVSVDPRAMAELRRAVGAAHVITDPDITASHAVDWTGRFRGRTPAVVRPADHHEVAAVVRACADHGVELVPQGGNTGLVGGSVALRDEVTLDLRRLDHLGPVDSVAGQVTVGAGVTLAALQGHARDHGLRYGVDLAARDTATVGGTAATNAGGIHVMRFGGTRQQVVGMRAVLGDGSTVSHLAGLTKDNTGYDLTGLLCGSEGTLGVITDVCVRLVPSRDHTLVVLVAFVTVEAAVDAVAGIRRSLDCLQAAELMLVDGVRLVADVTGRSLPFGAPHPVYVLLEAADHQDPTARLAAAVEACSGVLDVAVATDASRRGELWAYREDHTSAINTLGPPHKLDVTVPLDALASFAGEVPAIVAGVAPDARVFQFGHVGDGNLHVNVVDVDPDDTAVDDAVLRLVADMGGSISAEHGIGTAKKPWLHLSRTDEEIAAFRAIKRALDPAGILNPDVLLP